MTQMDIHNSISLSPFLSLSLSLSLSPSHTHTHTHTHNHTPTHPHPHTHTHTSIHTHPYTHALPVNILPDGASPPHLSTLLTGRNTASTHLPRRGLCLLIKPWETGGGRGGGRGKGEGKGKRGEGEGQREEAANFMVLHFHKPRQWSNDC